MSGFGGSKVGCNENVETPLKPWCPNLIIYEHKNFQQKIREKNLLPLMG
jgi:hypothetical protein